MVKWTYCIVSALEDNKMLLIEGIKFYMNISEYISQFLGVLGKGHP